MTGWKKKLIGVEEEQLRQQLRTETDPKAVKRLTAALLYADGSSPYEIERLLGFPAQTVYDWLDIVAERDALALGDRPRGGSRSRLTDDQWHELTATLAASPSEAGIDAPAWRPPLVRDYIAETFGVEYSLAHTYRVMHKAGLSVSDMRDFWILLMRSDLRYRVHSARFCRTDSRPSQSSIQSIRRLLR